MESKLAQQLFDLSAAYSKAMRLEESTVGRQCAADGRFFARLKEGKTFSVRKFDDVVAWFAANWPEGVVWPEGVERPEFNDGGSRAESPSAPEQAVA